MTRLRLLHTNDIHGRVDAVARVATLVEDARAEGPVLYLDVGDVEDESVRMSAVTRGAGMHRVLGAAGCEAAAVGNAGWMGYGMRVVPMYAAEAPYPLLLANIHEHGAPPAGVRESVLVEAGGVRVGLIGVTWFPEPFAEELGRHGIERVPETALVRRLAAALRERGAELVVLLSHLGLDKPADPIDDRRLAAEVQGDVDAILGAHSHHVLPEGERIGSVLVAQAGKFGAYLGCVEVGDGGLTASLVEVGEDVPRHPAVLAAAASVEPEVEAVLAEPIGTLPERMEPQQAALWLAAILRERSGADVGLVLSGGMFSGALPAGTLRRGALWAACDSRANPGVVTMTGEQLLAVLERGRDESLATTTPRVLRGRQRGLLAASGADGIDPARDYRVAATDFELEFGELVDPAWGLEPRSEFPTLVVEAIEEHLRGAA